MNIIDFLNARLNEDEASAKAAGSAPWVADLPRSVNVDPKATAANKHAFQRQGHIASVENPGAQAHIARHHPARALREIEAKRKLVHECQEAHQYYTQHPMAPAGEITGLHTAIKLAASVYADHPDYPEGTGQ